MLWRVETVLCDDLLASRIQLSKSMRSSVQFRFRCAHRVNAIVSYQVEENLAFLGQGIILRLLHLRTKPARHGDKILAGLVN